MFSKKIGVDLGTANIRVCSLNSKDIKYESNILIQDVNSGEYVKKGSDALELTGKL